MKFSQKENFNILSNAPLKQVGRKGLKEIRLTNSVHIGIKFNQIVRSVKTRSGH